MYELELFAGAGGGILGSLLCGHTCIGAVEIEEYPRKVLLQRQRDGILPEFPIWDDVKTFRIDNPETREYIQFLQSIREQLCISGGFPCQDISASGEGEGIKQGNRSGLWFEQARIIDEIRPAKTRMENSSKITSRGLGIVLRDLAQMGYNARWGVLGGVDVGACHERERMWIIASNNNSFRLDKAQILHKKPNTKESCRRELARTISACVQEEDHPYSTRNNDVLAEWMDRSKAIGNGQIPRVVKAAWEILK